MKPCQNQKLRAGKLSTGRAIFKSYPPHRTGGKFYEFYALHNIGEHLTYEVRFAPMFVPRNIILQYTILMVFKYRQYLVADTDTADAVKY